MEYDQKVIIQFLCKEGSWPATFTDGLRHSLARIVTARGVSGGDIWIFGKVVKTETTRRWPAAANRVP
jgi:hypothetical protein